VENGGREVVKIDNGATRQYNSRRRRKHRLLVFVVVVVEALPEKREEVNEGEEGKVLFCLLIF
jgi:hypothetical protein